MEKEWQLSSLDTFTLDMVIKGAWIYKEMPNAQLLSVSLKQLFHYYPHLTGHYNKTKKAIVWNELYTEEPTLEVISKPSLSIHELLDDKKRIWSLVREYSTKEFKKGKSFPFSASLIAAKDGYALIIQCAHAVMDGYSFYHLAEHWAALSRGEQIEPMVFDQEQIPSKDAYTKEEALKRVKENGWKKMSVGKLIKMLWYISQANKIKEEYIQIVSQEEISHLKQTSGAGTHAILSALAAKEIIKRVAHPTAYNVITVADLRNHLTGVSPMFMGNLSQPFITKEAFSPTLSTEELAKAIQQENTSILQSDELDNTVRLSICASNYHLPYFFFDALDISRPQPKAVYVNNQLKFKANELDFGGGKPLYAYSGELSDMIKFWQPVSGGPVQIIYKGFAAKLMKGK